MPFASSHPSQPITGGFSSRSQSLTAPAATGTLNRLTISVICSLVKRTSLIEFRKTWTSLSGTSYNQAFLRSAHQLHCPITTAKAYLHLGDLGTSDRVQPRDLPELPVQPPFLSKAFGPWSAILDHPPIFASQYRS